MVTGCQLAVYPTGKPYVNKVKINVVGDYKPEEKKRLESQLEKQLDDSLRVSRVQKKLLKIIAYNQKIYHAFDTGAIARTMTFFKYAYVANGYFRGGETTYRIDTVSKSSGKLELTLNARPHKNHKIDTVIYNIQDTILQSMALAEKDKALVKKGDLYSQEALNAERNRLANIYRNNGYYRITRENFKVVADTINRSLFVFTTDPFEQANLMYEATRFDQNPTTSVTFELASPYDSSRLRRYYIGNVDIYPDNVDKDVEPPNMRRINSYMTKRFFNNDFRNRLFPQNVYLKKGDLYRQSEYERTYNAFNFLGAWQQVNIVARDSIRKDTVDFAIYLLPFKKFQGERRLEGSINQNNTSGTTQSLWGINLSQSVKNRNVARQAIQSNLEARTGIEFRGRDSKDDVKENFINSADLSLTYDMLFPKHVPRFIPHPVYPKTLLTANAKYTQRFKLFKQSEINISHSWLWKNNKEGNWSISFLNFERKFLTPTDSLRKRIEQLPILAFIFNDGMIFGPKGSYSKANHPRGNVTGSKRYALESSFYAIPMKEFRNNLFKFAKAEAEFTWNIEVGKRNKNSFAFRTYAGLGLPFKRRAADDPTQPPHLPFFKQFIGGGPNSMRAWAVRTLNSYSTRTKSLEQREFYGDIKAEVNGEFRFLVRKVLGFPVRSALFLDMGNIWNWKPYDSTLVPKNIGTAQKIYNDIAIAGGTSVRVDFEYFLIRFDFGLKLKSPLGINGNGGWFDRRDFYDFGTIWNSIKMQVGINYPF